MSQQTCRWTGTEGQQWRERWGKLWTNNTCSQISSSLSCLNWMYYSFTAAVRWRALQLFMENLEEPPNRKSEAEISPSVPVDHSMLGSFCLPKINLVFGSHSKCSHFTNEWNSSHFCWQYLPCPYWAALTLKQCSYTHNDLKFDLGSIYSN